MNWMVCHIAGSLLPAGPRVTSIPASQPAQGAKVETIRYASSVDGTAPLLANVARPGGTGPRPLLVVMHGFSGNKSDVSSDIQAFARQGLFAVAVDMRGRGGSAGKRDCAGLEIHDILDAVLACVRQFPGEIDPKNLNLVGYSGGGGNAIACATRFPDLFQTSVSFFGVSDYVAWLKVEGKTPAEMAQLMSVPVERIVPAGVARDFNPAAGNVLAGRLHLFWDEEEKRCPPAMIEPFIAGHRKAGLDRVQSHVSRVTDAARYLHGYPHERPGLVAAEALYLPEVKGPKAASPALPLRGRLVVPGYLVTRRF